MVQLLDQLGISTCTVIGISGGGPTACALAADHPQRVIRLILAAALTQPETRTSEPSYKDQMAFYGPMHAVTWGMLGLLSRFSPKSMAKQTMAIFSTHDPLAVLEQLSPLDVAEICRFYQGQSARLGALSDARHTVGAELLNRISQPTLVIHSREDRSVPFTHAEWTMKNIPQAQLCEAGCTGHFFWVGPDYPRICQQLIPFLNN